MPRRFFRKFALKRENLYDKWWLAPFQHLLHERALWVIRRRTVVPAFALGLFIAYLPFPGHVITGIVLAIFARVNVPVAALSTLVSNPLTMGPMYYAAFSLGQELLQQPQRDFEFDMSIDWLVDQFVYIWQPLMLGSVILGTLLSLAGYITLDLLWRASLSDYLDKRRQKRLDKEHRQRNL